MEDERLILAVGRIERALDRVERSTGAALEALVASEGRRRRLEREAAEAVAAIDRLIGADG